LAKWGLPLTVSGDEAFRAFAIGCRPRLLAAAYLLTGDRGHAEDLTQSALLKVYLSWSKVESAEAPIAYARRILYTTFLRTRRRRRVAEDFRGLPDIAAPSAHINVENRDELRRLLAQLPPRQLAVIVLRFFEDMSIDEVARTLKCSTGTVKSQTSKALDALRKATYLEAGVAGD
jgi:RNA polymerase sigma-70 factor (sigma-E family)